MGNDKVLSLPIGLVVRDVWNIAGYFDNTLTIRKLKTKKRTADVGYLANVVPNIMSHLQTHWVWGCLMQKEWNQTVYAFVFLMPPESGFTFANSASEEIVVVTARLKLPAAHLLWLCQGMSRWTVIGMGRCLWLVSQRNSVTVCDWCHRFHLTPVTL